MILIIYRLLSYFKTNLTYHTHGDVTYYIISNLVVTLTQKLLWIFFLQSHKIEQLQKECNKSVSEWTVEMLRIMKCNSHRMPIYCSDSKLFLFSNLFYAICNPFKILLVDAAILTEQIMRLSVREPLPYWVLIDYQHTTFLTLVGQGGISLVKNLVGRIRVKEILIFLLAKKLRRPKKFLRQCHFPTIIWRG